MTLKHGKLNYCGIKNKFLLEFFQSWMLLLSHEMVSFLLSHKISLKKNFILIGRPRKNKKNCEFTVTAASFKIKNGNNVFNIFSEAN